MITDAEVNKLIGIPWLDRGRSRDGVDCLGLVNLAYAELFQVELPTYFSASAADVDDVARLVDYGRRQEPWREVERACHRAGDVALFRQSLKLPTHVGLVTGPWQMVHIQVGGVSERAWFGADSNRGRIWHGRLVSIHRHVALADDG